MKGLRGLWLLALVCSACEKKSASVGKPEPAANVEWISKLRAASPSPQPASAPPEIAAPIPQRVDLVPLEESPLALEHRYFASATTLDERMEVLRLLGASDAAEAVDALARIFRAERRFDSKMKVLEVLNDMDWSLHADRKLTLLALAADRSQQKLVRMSAITQLDEREDPRAAALIRGMMKDPDKDVREMATDLISARSEANR